MRRPSFFFLVFALAVVMAGMSHPASSGQYKDSVGRNVTVPERPGRIVSMAPNITEILFAVGAGDQVVGVTDFCDYPAEASERTRIGGFVNPSLEVVVSLKPDLVFATADGNRPADVLQMEKAGLDVFVIDTRTIGDIYESIRIIGRMTGHESQAGDLLADMTRRHGDVTAMVRDERNPRVLFLVGQNPMVGVGPGTFIHYLIEEAGGANALGDSTVKYPLLSMENLIAADPDVIVISVMNESTDVGMLAKQPGWEQMRASREENIYYLRDDSILRPGPRIIEALELLVGAFHPPAATGEP